MVDHKVVYVCINSVSAHENRILICLDIAIIGLTLKK